MSGVPSPNDPPSGRDPTDRPDQPDLGAAMPFAAVLGIGAEQITEHGLSATMEWRSDLCTVGDILHGGALMAFADSVGAAAAVGRLPAGTNTTTVSSATSFLAAARHGPFTAHATIEHAGSRFVTVRTEVRDGDRLVSITVQTQAVLPPR